MARRPVDNFDVQMHPGFPTFNQVKDDHEKMRSDHLPFYTAMRISIKELVSILSWNVMEADSFNGFGMKGVYGETSEQASGRHDRIADSAKRAVDNFSPDFICLQEIAQPTEDQKESSLYLKVQAALGENYRAIIYADKGVVDFEGCITFYNVNKFKPQLLENPSDHFIGSGNVTSFVSNSSSKPFHIFNVHHRFALIPLVHENTLKSFFNRFGKNAVCIAVGDFNGNIAPVGDFKPKNLVTCVSSPKFRGGTHQGASFIDGCFYSTNGREILQSEMYVLNPETGQFVGPEDMGPLDVSQLSDELRREVELPRLLIAVDHVYSEQTLVSGVSIFVYESLLKQEFNNQDVVVRPTRTLNNMPGLAVPVPHSVANQFFCFDGKMQDEFRWSIPGKTTPDGHYFIITMPVEQVDAFTKRMGAFLNHRKQQVKKAELQRQSKEKSFWNIFSSKQPEVENPLRSFPYQQSDQTFYFDINMDYVYSEQDIIAVMGQRVGLLNQYLLQQSKISAPLVVHVPPEMIQYGNSFKASLTAFLHKNKPDQGIAFYCIPVQKKGQWSALVVQYDANKKSMAVCYSPALDIIRLDILGGIRVGFMGSDDGQEVEYEEFVHFIDVNSTVTSGLLVIENMIQAVKNFLSPEQYPFNRVWCDDNDVATFRGRHVQLMSGPQQPFYLTQKENKSPVDVDSTQHAHKLG